MAFVLRKSILVSDNWRQQQQQQQKQLANDNHGNIDDKRRAIISN